jgi:mRNA interferase RelE/StbE
MAKARYQVTLAPSAVKALRQLPDDARRRIVRGIESLEADPRPPGVKKLTGTDDLYRIRVGDDRIIYQIDDPDVTVLVLRIAHRGDVYRKG